MDSRAAAAIAELITKCWLWGVWLSETILNKTFIDWKWQIFCAKTTTNLSVNDNRITSINRSEFGEFEFDFLF